MTIASTVKRWLLAAVGLSLLAAAASAGAEGRTPLPVVPKAKGDQCVEDPGYMRRHHMELLMHQRDDTLRRGIRTTRYSLKHCLSCHVPSVEEKKVEFGSNEHFCSSCHNYAAVRIDCFECHATQPSGTTAASE
ncbi:hypothetical protein JCM17961_20220 [Endothiovibrio diazotrophicus]